MASSNSDGTHSEVGHHADQGGGAFPPFNGDTFGSQLLWLAITFGFLYFMMARYIVPRIGSILETRSNRIEQDMAEAQRLKDETDEAIASYEQALQDAKNRAHSIAQDARDKAKAESDEAMAKTEADVKEKLDAAEKTISDMREKALSEVDAIATDTTEAIVKSLIGGRVAKGDIKKALESLEG